MPGVIPLLHDPQVLLAGRSEITFGGHGTFDGERGTGQRFAPANIPTLAIPHNLDGLSIITLAGDARLEVETSRQWLEEELLLTL